MQHSTLVTYDRCGSSLFHRPFGHVSRALQAPLTLPLKYRQNVETSILYCGKPVIFQRSRLCRTLQHSSSSRSPTVQQMIYVRSSFSRWLRVPTALLYAFQCARQIPNSIRLSSTKTSHIQANNNRLSSGFVPSNREISRCSEVYTSFTISSASSRFARNLDCWLWKRASVQGHERAHLYTHRHWKYRVAGDD